MKHVVHAPLEDNHRFSAFLREDCGLKQDDGWIIRRISNFSAFLREGCGLKRVIDNVAAIGFELSAFLRES